MIKLTATLIILFSVLSFKQAPDNKVSKEKKFTQFIVTNANDAVDAAKIDKYMKAQAGVLMSRMDIVSHKYLIIFKGDMNYDLPYFEETFEKLGYEIKCFRQGVRGKDKIINQKLDCE